MSAMKGLLKRLKASLVHFCFPSHCLYCGDELPPNDLVLCESCTSLLELIDPSGRCSTCFNPFENSSLPQCQYCCLYPSAYVEVGAAFDYEHLAAALVKQLKYGNLSWISKGMAAYLVVQFLRLNWPLPDEIVSVPLSLMRMLDRGYNQSRLLAEEVGKILNRPVCNVLERRSGDYSQAALDFEQRRKLDANAIILRKDHSIHHKVLLVIDDVMTTRSTLERCAEALRRGEPSALYALTFCRTQTQRS